MNPEQLAYWYFRLNGFLTTVNFVVHPEQGGRTAHRRRYSRCPLSLSSRTSY